MKKLLIVNNNMKVGGVQKSLYNLLWSLDGRYEITLYLFRNMGEYADKLPKNIEIIEDHSLFSYLGCSQADCADKLGQRLVRGALAALCRTFGRHAAMKLLLLSKRTLPEEYDCAIAYLHNGNPRNFYGGVQDFVLHRVKAKRKVAFLHCDYAVCGANNKKNNRLLYGFDLIAACSEGCRRSFVRTVPELEERCRTVHNCHRFEEIRTLSKRDPVIFGGEGIHLLMVCRMAHEKGVERAIRAVKAAHNGGLQLTLHLVGDGAMLGQLRTLTAELCMEDHVRFHGEQDNPYRYMLHADLFLLSSYHEAAPLVIEEAACVGLPVLSVETTSVDEMITGKKCGWVCKNSQEALEQTLIDLLSKPEMLSDMRQALCGRKMNNSRAVEDFVGLVEE